MEILFITNVNINAHNGAVRHINHFIKNAEKIGNKIHLCYYRNKKNILNNLFQAIWFSFNIFKNKNSYELVYIRYYPLCILEILTMVLIGKPYVVEYNAVIEEEISDIHRYLRPMKGIFKMFSRMTAVSSNGVIVLSKGIGTYINKEYHIKKEKIHVSSNGGEKTNLLKDHIVHRKGVIAVNDIGWYDIPHLIDIKEKLIKRGIGLDIYVATSGQKRLYDKVIYNKPVNYNEYDWGLIVNDSSKGLNRIRFGIRPTKYFEYLSYGLPVIIPDIKDINDITKQYKCGIIYCQEDQYSLFNAIKILYENKALYKLMRENALQMISEKYDWNILVKDIFEFIRSCIYEK